MDADIRKAFETTSDVGYDTSVVEESGDVGISAGAPPSSLNVPGIWKKVGYLDMSDPTQSCPASWMKFYTPRATCGKKTSGTTCDSVAIGTAGSTYSTVCGRFRAYQVGSTDAFGRCGLSASNPRIGNYISPNTIEDPYVDGISITYGSPGQRHHVFTYAAGVYENSAVIAQCNCPCAQGTAPPPFVGSDYYCESGVPTVPYDTTKLYSADILWDGKDCAPLEATCCASPNLAWFCKTFPTPISGNLEIRICTDEGLDNENVALEFYELYIK